MQDQKTLALAVIGITTTNTREVLAFVTGDRHEASCLLLFYAVIRSLKFRRIAVETKA